MLPSTETSRLVDLEAVIERGLRDFVSVGDALKEINDNRLWSPEYESFDAYCAGRWNFHRRTGYSLITAAGVAHAVAGKVQAPALSYSHAAEMVTLKPDQQVTMARKIVSEHLSTRDVRRLKDELYPAADAKPKKEPYAPPRGRASIDSLDTASPESADVMLYDDPEIPSVIAELGHYLRPGGSLLIPYSVPIVPASTEPMQCIGIIGVALSVPFRTGPLQHDQYFYEWYSKGQYIGDPCSNRLSSLAALVKALTYAGDTIYHVNPTDRSVLDEAVLNDRHYVALDPPSTLVDAIEAYRQDG